MLHEDPEEQKAIREARRLRGKGMSLRAIKRDLEARGIRSRNGNGWYLDVLSRMVAGG